MLSVDNKNNQHDETDLTDGTCYAHVHHPGDEMRAQASAGHAKSIPITNNS